MKKIPSYAAHASDRFNESLDRQLAEITADVRNACGRHLVALILGGGYGRGEGGVVLRNGEEHPYNDLDFTIVVDATSNYPVAKMADVSRKHEAIVGIEVDFSRPLTVNAIQRWPHWLMWYDLLLGHIVLFGPESVLAENAPSDIRQPLPSTESIRLLLNRGAGILWAKMIIRGLRSAPDPDFIRRNYFKGLLALGDSLLIIENVYETKYAGRDGILAACNSLEKEPFFPELLSLYREALEFKFRPDSFNDIKIDENKLNELAVLWSQVFLYVENTRLQHEWTCLDEYLQWKGIREPEENRLKKLPRNILQNLKSGMISWKYRREYLFQQLPDLLEVTDKTLRNWDKRSNEFIETWFKFN
jgi:hypothetical protein